MSDENINKCGICGNPASQKCAGCHLVYYCCREHQKTDWKGHKKVCRPFKVREDDVLGRYVIATRDIKPGEIILQEGPLIWGPSQTTIPVCLGCGDALTEKNCRPCIKCGWPVCSETCEKSPAHIPECRYTVLRGDKVAVKNLGIIHPIYQCITVLRCLYQKQFLPEVWKKLEKLQSHCEERRKSPKYENDRVAIAQFILRFFKLENVFTEDDIMRICGIVMVNGHEVPLSEPPHVSIYQSCSLFEHNCRPNCKKSFTNRGEILITSGEKIEKGKHLSICYTDPLWGTSNRRHHLFETKFFWCTCERCKDVTECGTHFSTVKCQNRYIHDCNGYLLPKSFIDNDLLDWKCNKCPSFMNAYSVQDILDRIGKDLSQIEKGNSKACKKFIANYDSYLHPNHYYMTDVKIALTDILGQEFPGGLPNLSEDDLNLKAKLCQSLSRMIQILIPGESRVRGTLLFELHAAVTEIGRRQSLSDPEILKSTLLESRRILTEAAELLKHEPDCLPEGKLYQQAKLNLEQIDKVIKTVHKTFGDTF